MRRFICKVTFAVTLVVAILMLLLCVKRIDPNNYLQAYTLKCQLLEETPGPRLIFVGGSNLAFGIDSKRIADSLGVNVINAGLHAGVGIKFMLDDVAEYVREGDVVVIAPEYQHFYQSIDPQTLAIVQSIAGWEKMRLLDMSQVKEILRGLPAVVYHRPDKAEYYEYYNLQSFNEWGDVSRHWMDSTCIKPIPVTTAIEAPFDENVSRHFITKLGEIKQSATVCVIPPVCRQSAFDAMGKAPSEVEHFLLENGIPFIVHPQEHVLDNNYALDTDYHMNARGVEMFTTMVIDELRPLLNRTF